MNVTEFKNYLHSFNSNTSLPDDIPSLKKSMHQIYSEQPLYKIFLAKCPKSLTDLHKSELLDRLVREINDHALVNIVTQLHSNRLAFGGEKSLVGDEQIEILKLALVQVDKKITLILQGVNIGDHELESLFPLLKAGKIEDLNLCNNSITDEGVKTLCSSILSINECALCHLELDKNPITDEGAEQFTSWVGNNDHMVSLSLVGTEVSEKVGEKLELAASKGGQLSFCTWKS